MLGQARLMVGDELIATLDGVNVDMPWFECRFTPEDAFEKFAPLFERELSLVEAPGEMDVEEWERTMREIWSRGLVLVLDGGERIEEYALHVYADGTARLRY